MSLKTFNTYSNPICQDRACKLCTYFIKTSVKSTQPDNAFRECNKNPKNAMSNSHTYILFFELIEI